MLNNLTTNYHCHLASIPDLDMFLNNSDHVYISNALDNDELDKHLLYINKPNLFFTTGQHPLYPENSITIDRTVSLLEENKLFAIGEIGFDKRNPDFDWQKKVFLEFCDIAKQYEKPIIVHNVGYYYDLLSIIKKNFPDLQFILHAFQGSVDVVKAYSKYDVIFSLHKDIIKIKNSQNILKEIFNNHKYVFETDVCKEGKHDVTETIDVIKRRLA